MADERERLAARLREHGERRRAALDTAEEELEAIKPLVPRAIELGLSQVEIARLTAVSRQTIIAWLKPRSR
jgi:hypothetical protein